MTWNFGDSFDLYAATGDMVNGYWDSASNPQFFGLSTATRFSVGQCLALNNFPPFLVKSSGVNDPVHHLVCSFRQTAAISGANLIGYFALFDGTTAQCSVVFRSDGAILLQSGGVGGTTLATYTSAFPLQNTWYGFEIEVVINNTTGSIAVRRNGNNVNDFSLGSLNTRGGTANNYANKIQFGGSSLSGQVFDDFYWQSGAATGSWLGELRCLTRMPVSDQSVQFLKSPASYVQAPFPNNFGTFATSSTSSYYLSVISTFTGTVSAVQVQIGAGFTGNMKCAIFADNGLGTLPTTILGTTAPATNPATGSVTFTFTPISVVKGTTYWIGLITDGNYANGYGACNGGGWTHSFSNAVTYAAFPVANPSIGGSANPWPVCSWTIAVGTNSTLVNEPQQDGLTSYVYDSNLGDADFYGIAPASNFTSAPFSTVATITRGYMQKSDAGTRTAAVQVKSGATTVATPTLVLTSTGFQWISRLDLTDPNTSAAWTAAAVAAMQIGPTVIA